MRGLGVCPQTARGLDGYNGLFGGPMTVTCTRCGQIAEPPPANRIAFAQEAKQRILGATCAACWKEWEGMEVKVINEYRLSFLDPEHREMLKRACLDFLKLQQA
jgi:Fe-S cluster biosynthesis and repair protein YggX